MKFDKKMLTRYFILGTQDVSDEKSFYSILEQALRHGINLFQYREKGVGSLTGQDKINVARRVREMTAAYQVPLVIDDDIALAHLVAADGVHFGQGDGSVEANIAASKGLFVGVSVSTLEEYNHIAEFEGIDHIGVGPVFETTSKFDANPAIGLIGLKELVQKSRWPVVAIGGIERDNLAAVVATKVAGVAVISMISQNNDISNILQYWQQF